MGFMQAGASNSTDSVKVKKKWFSSGFNMVLIWFNWVLIGFYNGSKMRLLKSFVLFGSITHQSWEVGKRSSTAKSSHLRSRLIIHAHPISLLTKHMLMHF